MEEINPPSISLVRDDDRMHILGTFHAMTYEMYQGIISRGIDVENFFDEASMFFSEAGEIYITDVEYERIRELITGSGTNRQSVSDIVGSWDTESQVAFQDMLDSYPLLDHVGRQASIYAARPYHANDFLYRDIILRAWGNPTDYSIDGIYKAMAAERSLFDHRLDDPVEIWEMKDSLTDDEAQMDYLISRLTFPMTRDEIEDSQLEELQFLVDSWISGNIIHPSEYDFENASRAWGELDQSVRDTLDANRAKWIWHPREERWVSVIDSALEENQRPQTLVLAVGYGHLISPPSEFIPLLLEAGWQIEEQRFRIADFNDLND
ncbi:hypothetical protein L21SP2_0355 [Salinispira pacifica]|uniref:Uncharacterized protein n=1 Tax=Salinispira pacifica TaxID=1307761 RepID=V5WF40_9SPIO|nr:hypothetical protein L21SP2_0355 [Salinispira pacifica]